MYKKFLDLGLQPLANKYLTKSIKKYLKSQKPNYRIHLAGLSRPMKIHEKYIDKSIDLNIIGTANVTKACSELGIMLIYFSTSHIRL